ncbi:hypothetical protein [Salipiger bermudensis]|uniref:hypothetical protein n=1 Tax=Salipiger bermudensis TaxID=344736 RepID=UPI001CD35D04|nr:hypothetical protein [Salipiger bermudensis]MCA0961530.1 hypothetical protein [Salipiger bermudensis]
MRAFTFLAAAAALSLSASQALAWDDAYKGDATADASRQPLIQAYPAANYCPSGKQPVIVGGVIFCGVPTAGTYYDPVSSPRTIVATQSRYLPRAYNPDGYHDAFVD